MGTLRTVTSAFTLAFLFDSSLAELKECFAWSSPKFIDAPENVHNSTGYRTIINALTVKSNEFLFVSIPRDKPDIVPCTLAYVNITTDLGNCESPLSPELACFPSFAANQPDPESCDNIFSVYKGIKVDMCNRLWVADSGWNGPSLKRGGVQVCPPRIHVFDLTTHQKLRMFTLPPSVLASPSPDQFPFYFSDVTVDSGKDCDGTFFYMVDKIGLIVYSWKENDAWRFEHPYFRPDPLQGTYDYGSIRVEWHSGIGSVATSDFISSSEFRTLYFRPFASTKEFSVSTEVLHNKTASFESRNNNFTYVGDREILGMSMFSTISKNTGAMFFGLVSSNSTVCWNTKNPYNPSHFHTVATDQEFPAYHSLFTMDGSDVLCLLTNKLPQYLYGKLDYSVGVKNFVNSCGNVDDLISNTVCERKSAIK